MAVHAAADPMLDSDKKKLIGQALLNFVLGSLQAVDFELVRILPVKEAVPMLGKVTVDATGFVGGVVKLARAGSAPASLNV